MATVLAAKEKTLPAGEALPQPQTRVWGSALENSNAADARWPATSTLTWGWRQFYAGTAADSLVQRYYTATAGRFYTPDPAGMAAVNLKDPISWNMYAYAGDDPVNYSDPLGRDVYEGQPPPGYCDLYPGAGICWRSPPPTAAPGPPGLVASPLSRALAAAQYLQNKKDWSSNCNKTLTDAGISPKDLDNGLTVDAVSQVQAAAQQAQIMYGNGSSIHLVDAYANAANPDITRLIDPTVTIGDIFANSPNTHAMSDLGGNRIWISAMYFDTVGSAMAAATIMHELLHNITGLTDPDLQRNLGLPEAGGSLNITLRLMADCFTWVQP